RGSAERHRCPGRAAWTAARPGARRAAGIGIDTLSVDRGADVETPVHRITLPAGLWHLEGLVGLERMPPRGAWVIVGVVPVVEGSGAPARVIALVPTGEETGRPSPRRDPGPLDPGRRRERHAPHRRGP